MLITREETDGTFGLTLTPTEASDLANFIFTKHDGDADCGEWPDTFLIASMLDDVHLAQTGEHMDGVIDEEAVDE